MTKRSITTDAIVLGAGSAAVPASTTDDVPVFDVFGSHVPGLYAVGDCAGALGPIAELGGTRISGAFTFGWLAGRVVAEGRSSSVVRPDVFGSYLPHRLENHPALSHLEGTFVK